MKFVNKICFHHITIYTAVHRNIFRNNELLRDIAGYLGSIVVKVRVYSIDHAKVIHVHICQIYEKYSNYPEFMA